MKLHSCRKRRHEHTCDKENARKEYAERLVASALKEYVLRDDVIEWVADSVLKFQETLKGQSQLAYYQDKLVEVKRSLDNIMKAIEAVPSRTQSRHAGRIWKRKSRSFKAR